VDDPTDAVAVAEAIGELFANEDRRRSMAEAGRLRAEHEFSYDVLADRLRAGMDAAILRPAR
jgi:glycosyltransferase involved in cell wall biosynthesis